MKDILIYLVDDSAEFLQMIAQFLNCQPHFRVVGTSKSGVEALRMIPAMHPDVVVMDISMPELNGIETTRRLKLGHSELPVVMLTTHDVAGYRAAAALAGANGFVLKSDCCDQLVQILENVVMQNAAQQ
jgi:DNA-binding NarL/FixJ family response regulator